MNAEIQHLPYADADESLRREIACLQDRAYGSPDSDPTSPLHDLSLAPQSFLLRVDGRLVSYATVLTKAIHHDGVEYVASGLSCVATDPNAARRGYASRIIAAATANIASSGVDLGVFTCAPHLVRLYSTAGGWQPAPDTILIGSSDPAALTSTSIGAVVLLRLFSPRAIDHAATWHNTTIDLNLPVGQFW